MFIAGKNWESRSDSRLSCCYCEQRAIIDARRIPKPFFGTDLQRPCVDKSDKAGECSASGENEAGRRNVGNGRNAVGVVKRKGNPSPIIADVVGNSQHLTAEEITVSDADSSPP